MSADQFARAVRFQGSCFREHINKLALQFGDGFGEEFCRRAMWEMAAWVLEVCGPTVAEDMLRAALEGIQIDHPPEIVDPDGVDPLTQITQALEGLTTLQEQTRLTVAGLAELVNARLPASAPQEQA